jgi:hypothetical protein
MLVGRLVGARAVLRVRLLLLWPHDGPVFPGNRVPVRHVLDALLVVEAQLRAQRADLRHTQRSRICAAKHIWVLVFFIKYFCREIFVCK